ncbi:phosphatase PAP2 family protein [Rhizobium sp. RAF56]|uniref:phosphatase PAP2 family protein n=1 Tax=Rhizobium sp. RAF56 TaxID=3233062 RepID=UPI003F9C4CC6
MDLGFQNSGRAGMDSFLTSWINGLSGQIDAVDHLMILVSMIGIPAMVAGVAGQWWIGPDRTYIRHVAVAAGLSFLIGLGINQIILMFFARSRPYEAGLTQLLIDRTSDPSFPSDHATAGFAIAATFLLHGIKGRGVAFLMAACLIAFSRVYVGTHYVSDVVGGGIIGAASAALIMVVYRRGSRIDRLVTNIL